MPIITGTTILINDREEPEPSSGSPSGVTLLLPYGLLLPERLKGFSINTLLQLPFLSFHNKKSEILMLFENQTIVVLN